MWRLTLDYIRAATLTWVDEMPSESLAKAFSPGQIGTLRVRNRFIKAATYEGMCPGGVPSDDIVEHHRRLAAGGVGLTTLAYCAVSPDGRTFENQLVMHAGVRDRLQTIIAAVHGHGAAIAVQLGHAGNFSRNREVTGGRPAGPSFTWNMYGTLVGLPFARAMTAKDIATVTEDFGRAAAMARETGFDAVELHLGHGYLLSQFLSPASNRRRDQWGRTLEGRMRLPLDVVRRVRSTVGADFPIIIKMNLRDGFRGGLEIDEAVAIATALERAGVDAIVGSGGFTGRNPLYLFRGKSPLRSMIDAEHSSLQKWAFRLFGPFIVRGSPFEELYFLPLAARVREAVRIPVILLGGVVSRAGVETAMQQGFEFVALGRTFIADPDFVARLERGELDRSRCDACNECVAEMERPGGVRCVLDDAERRGS